MNDYSQLSLELTNLLSKDEKKNMGIFLTPQTIIKKLVDRISHYQDLHSPKFSRILEPSCGSCEFIKYLSENYHHKEILGIELNKTIFSKIKDLKFQGNGNKISLKHMNFLDLHLNMDATDKYDLIIGNPPYVVIGKQTVPKKWHPYCLGRPNLFCVFILQSLALLAEGGILAFIIPKSFLNSGYYAETRRLIMNEYSLLEITDFEEDNKFIETEQSTIGLIVRHNKKKHMNIEIDENPYIIPMGGTIIFSPYGKQLKDLVVGSGITTLEKMGLKVKTGNVVWNQVKPHLVDEQNGDRGILLIYNTNVVGNQLERKNFKNDEKKQYIDIEGTNISGSNEIVLVVNRGNGNSSYKLNYCLIDLGEEKYAVENHLNVIYFVDSKSKKREEILEVYRMVIKSFQDPRTSEFIKLFLGNNGLSKTELETIFPIYV